MTHFPSVRLNQVSLAFTQRSAGLAGALVAVALTCTQVNAAGDGQYQSIAGIEAFIGVVRAEITKGHAPTGPEAEMHGGIPTGGHQYHLIAAVFDAKTGTRIADAAVTAQVSGLGLAGAVMVLEPMSLASTVTYGAYFDLPGPDLYAIALTVKRPAAEQPTLRFNYATAISEARAGSTNSRSRFDWTFRA
jgi:hypothetical protein